jgi:excisionase family DNA binding protein
VRPADRLREALAPDVVAAIEELIQERLNARDALVDTEDAARELGISPAAVRMRVFRGSLPAVRAGRRLRIPRSSLTAARGKRHAGDLFTETGAAPG